MQKLIIGILSIGERHTGMAVDLIENLYLDNAIKVLVVTDSPKDFVQFHDIIVIEHYPKIFSYNDKVLVFKHGFEYSDKVLLLDSDHVIRDLNKSIPSLSLESLSSGVYPQIVWKDPCDCSMENFLAGKTPRVPYGIKYKQFCDDNGIKTVGGILVQESFIFMKKPAEENLRKFFDTWTTLGNFCDYNDVERNQGILGYGEGYNIGIAALNSDIPIILDNPVICVISDNFKHLAWEN